MGGREVTLLSRVFLFGLDLCLKGVNFCFNLYLKGFIFDLDLFSMVVFSLVLNSVTKVLLLVSTSVTPVALTSVSRVYLDLDLVPRTFVLNLCLKGVTFWS
jgi:hypothetical protein